MSTDSPKAIGSPPNAFRIALEILSRVGAKTVLDCPSGEGVFTRMLRDEGYETTAADILPENFKLNDVECDFCDLNDHLPYENERFDAVVCLNGLQRIWARGRAVRELARVVKPGGTLIISFPNNADIRRRMLFLMTGSVTWNVIGPPTVCRPEAANPAATFRYPMTVANVVSAIESVGLQCESLRHTHVTAGALLLSPFAFAAKIFSIFAPDKVKKRYYLKESSTSSALLGAFLVTAARKPS
jgi:SAM-dependent methyltransferase